MKKQLLTLFAVLGLAITAHATDWSFSSLLTGYNVLVPTNLTGAFPTGAGTYAGLGQSNVLFTTYSGQTLYSLTNNINFALAGGTSITNVTQVLNTNTIASDAFKPVTLWADANGDINANASLFIMVGNTNYEPWLYWNTNASGQVYIGTNSGGVFWPLNQSTFPNWTYPATPNTYPTWPVNTTNAITVNLFAGSGLMYIPPSGGGTSVPPGYPKMWETTASFSCTFNVAAGVPTVLTTNLPTVFTQHAKEVYCTISVANVAGLTATTNQLINMLGILQPTP